MTPVPRRETVIREALELGLQAWRTTTVREKFHRAFEALDALEDQTCRLLAEREFGPQPFACPDPICSVVSVGSGYDSCPRCGGPLVAAESLP